MHVFTVFILKSETMGPDYSKFSLGCIIIIIIILLHLIILFSYHEFTTVMHCKFCPDSIPRICGHICDEALALYNLCWFVVPAGELDLLSVTPLSVAG